jgi:hypothetical protein
LSTVKIALQNVARRPRSRACLSTFPT